MPIDELMNADRHASMLIDKRHESSHKDRLTHQVVT